jgi:hypothetical protein
MVKVFPKQKSATVKFIKKIFSTAALGFISDCSIYYKTH